MSPIWSCFLQNNPSYYSRIWVIYLIWQAEYVQRIKNSALEILNRYSQPLNIYAQILLPSIIIIITNICKAPYLWDQPVYRRVHTLL